MNTSPHKSWLVRTAGLALFLGAFPVAVQAWTIEVLSTNHAYEEFDVLEAANYADFRSYFSPDVNLTKQGDGTLANYTDGRADAVIINCPSSSNASLSLQEIAVIQELLASDTRVIIFSDNQNWNDYNQQLANIVGGNYLGAPNATVTTDINQGAYPLLTDGASTLEFNNPGRIEPLNGNGFALDANNVISLWGVNENLLLFLDVGAFMPDDRQKPEGGLQNADNAIFAQNVANWLGGAAIPEPSTYGMICGFLALGTVAFVRIRRK